MTNKNKVTESNDKIDYELKRLIEIESEIQAREKERMRGLNDG